MLVLLKIVDKKSALKVNATCRIEKHAGLNFFVSPCRWCDCESRRTNIKVVRWGLSIERSGAVPGLPNLRVRARA